MDNGTAIQLAMRIYLKVFIRLKSKVKN